MPGDDAEEDWFERALSGDEADAEAVDESGEKDTDESDENDVDLPDETDIDGPNEKNVEAVDAPGDGGPDGVSDDPTARGPTDSERRGPAVDPDGMPAGFDMGADAGTMDDFGFDLGSETEDFEEADYRTDIPRIDVGIDGLDEMIQGGIPEQTLMVAIGGPGTGKTTFGLQFLNEALANGERAVFIALDETEERVVASAEEKGWPFGTYVEDGDLVVIDLDPVEMAHSLAGIRSDLPRLIEEYGASRLTIDSVSLLEMMYDDQATRRTEIYDFARSLEDAGVTTLVTSESDEDNPFASRYGLIEYLTDAVFVLRYVRSDDFQETRLAIEIQKIRDANHSRAIKPYELTSTGIAVYRQANIF